MPTMDNYAIFLPRFGDASVLSINPVPVPQRADILVKVAAAGVNPVDFKTREGHFPPVPQEALPIVMGRDLAGTVVAYGEEAAPWIAEGQSGFAFFRHRPQGTGRLCADQERRDCACPARTEHGAGHCRAAGRTDRVARAVRPGRQAGQGVLIHGGADGVGHFAVQLAKAKGAFVTSTCSGADLDFVGQPGADEVIDYTSERFEDRASDMDVIFDLVGGHTQDRSRVVLRAGGIVISTLEEPDAERADGQRRAIWRGPMRDNCGRSPISSLRARYGSLHRLPFRSIRCRRR